MNQKNEISKHSPSPWIFLDGYIDDANGEHIAEIGYGIPASQHETDGRLLAVAPDLLEALITALPYVEHAEFDEGYKPGAVKKVVDKIKAAIAKAEAKEVSRA
jgi:hypothetical protein